MGVVHGGNYKTTYKYNITTNSYTRLTDSPENEDCRGMIAVVGTDVYLLGRYDDTSTRQVFRYDTLTDTYTRLVGSQLPIKSAYDGCAVVFGTDIYIFLSNVNATSDRGDYCYKFNTVTLEYTRLDDIPIEFYKGIAVIQDSKIYLCGGMSSQQKIQCYDLGIKSFNNNSVIISQPSANNSGIDIELYSNIKNQIAPKYSFYDAWFYTTQGGLITDIPTYYGDGTQWVKFKN